MIAPPARVGVRDPLRISREEIIEGFYDISTIPMNSSFMGGGCMHYDMR
jgi:hypothetical protein